MNWALFLRTGNDIVAYLGSLVDKIMETMRKKYFRTYQEALVFSKRSSHESNRDSLVSRIDRRIPGKEGQTIWCVWFHEPWEDSYEARCLLDDEELAADADNESHRIWDEECAAGDKWDRI